MSRAPAPQICSILHFWERSCYRAVQRSAGGLNTYYFPFSLSKAYRSNDTPTKHFFWWNDTKCKFWEQHRCELLPLKLLAMTFAALICNYFYPVSSKLEFVWIHHVCFYRILEFTYVLTFLIYSYRWLLTWSICQDKHLQQGTSTVLLWSNLYHWAAQTSQCLWCVKGKATQRMELGANTCAPWGSWSGLECSITLRFLVVFATYCSFALAKANLHQFLLLGVWVLVFHYLPLMERKTRSEICRRIRLIYLLELVRQYEINSPPFLQKETCTEKLKYICTSAPFPKSLEETNKNLT